MKKEIYRMQNHRETECEVLVNGLFLDYDWTISRLNVLKAESEGAQKNRVFLEKINRKIPVAIITTKNLSVIENRTPFTHAWSGIGDLEMKTGNTVFLTVDLSKVRPYMKVGLEYAKSLTCTDLVIEEKRDSKGVTVAFSVGWR